METFQNQNQNQNQNIFIHFNHPTINIHNKYLF
jgi:hypothetical protein